MNYLGMLLLITNCAHGASLPKEDLSEKALMPVTRLLLQHMANTGFNSVLVTLANGTEESHWMKLLHGMNSFAAYLSKDKIPMTGPHHVNIFLQTVFDEEKFNATLSTLQTSRSWSVTARFIVIYTRSNLKANNVEKVFRLFRSVQVFNAFIIFSERGRSNVVTYYPFVAWNSDKIYVKFLSHEITKSETPHVFPRVINNLNGYTIKASIVSFPGKALLENPMDFKSPLKENCYEMNMIKVLTKAMNATLVIVAPSDGGSFGYRLRNGTITGTSGDVAYGRADIAANGRFYKADWLDAVQYTFPCDQDDLCVIVPKAGRVPKYQNVFLPLRLDAWTATLCSLAFASCFWWFLKRGASSLSEMALNTLGSFLAVSLPSLPPSVPERVFLFSWIGFSMVLTSAYQGSLTSYLTVPQYLRDMNTLQELYSSGIRIRAVSGVEQYLFNDSDADDIINKLYKNIEVAEMRSSGESGPPPLENCALLIDRYGGRFMINSVFFMPQGVQTMHMMKECPMPTLVVYEVPKHSPFLPRFDLLLQRMLEAGLFDQWTRNTEDEMLAKGQFVMSSIGRRRLEVLGLDDLQAAFYLLIIGLGSSFGIFVTEKLSRKVNCSANKKLKSSKRHTFY